MSKVEFEIHPYNVKIPNILKMCKNELSENNYLLIEKYDRQMVNDTLSYATRCKNLETVLSLCRLIKKDWKDVVHEDISQLVYGIMTKYSKNGQETHSTYDHKKILKIFFRWFKLGSRSMQDVGNPAETDKIKMKSVKNKIIREQLLTDDDIVLLLKSSRNARDKAMISVAAESGCRPGELLSLRIKHVKVDQYGAILSVDGKTGARNVRIVKSVPHLMQWIDIHPFKDDSDFPLWIVINSGERYGKAMDSATWRHQLQDTLYRTGLSKRIYPNLFRHTAATNAANYLTESQLRKRQVGLPKARCLAYMFT